MSNCYFVYTEIRINNEWHCVNQYLPRKNKETGVTEYILIPTYDSGSRSYFGSTFDEIREIGNGKPKNISPEILVEHPEREKNPNNLFSDYYENMTASVLLKDLANHLPGGNRKQHCGIYHKDRIFEFETGDREDLYECEADPKEYAKYPPELQDKVYQYYEWDDPMDWPKYFRIILERSERLIAEYLDFNQQWYADYEARILVYCY